MPSLVDSIDPRPIARRRSVPTLGWIFAIAAWFVLSTGAAAAVELSGSVTHGEDAPIAGARVVVTNEAGTTSGLAVTGADGRWVLDIATGERFRLRASADGFVTVNWPSRPCAPLLCDELVGAVVDTAGSDRGDLDFALPEEARLAGTVTASDTGQPLANVTVDVFDEVGRLAATDLASNGLFDVGGLPAGSYRLRASSPSYSSGLFGGVTCSAECDLSLATAVSVPNGVTLDGLDIVLAPRGRVSGSVSRPDGTPLQLGTVAAFDAAGFLVTTGTVVDGEYTLDGLPAGDLYLVALDSPPYVGELWSGIPCQATATYLGCDPTSGEPVSVTPGSIVEGVDFRLNEGGAIRGRVRTAAGESLVDHPVVLLGPLGEIIQETTTDIQGDYRFDGVGAGPVYAAARETETRVAELYREQPCWALGCDVSSGQPLGPAPGGFVGNIDFSLDLGGALSGRVTVRDGSDPAGSGLAGVAVTLFAADGSQSETTFTGEGGVYRFDALPAGQYIVLASAEGFVAQAWEGQNFPEFVETPSGGFVPQGDPVTVQAGGEASDVSFLLVEPPRLAGRVTDLATGEGLVVEVELYGPGGVLLESTTTTSEGDYQFEPPTAGSYWIVTRNDSVYEDQQWPGVSCINDPEVGVSCGFPAERAVDAEFDTLTDNLDFALEIGGALVIDVEVEGGGEVPEGIEGLLYTDADGLVARTVGAPLAFPRLPSGDYFVVARAEGFPDQVYRGEICGVLCEFPLSAAVSVDGLVRPSDPLVLRQCSGDCDERELIVQQDRFEVTARFTDFEGTTGSATAVQLTDDSGYFWFFRDTNVELVVKVLDACQPPFEHFWVFAAGLTNVEVEIEVVDRLSGETVTYDNALGQAFQPILDTFAFDTCDAGAPASDGVGTEVEAAPQTARAPHRSLFQSPLERALRGQSSSSSLWKDGDCTAGEEALCLQAERFRVEIAWDTGSETGVGQAVPLTADTGYFWFFRDTNIEAVVKVLDACQPPFDRFWVFAAGLTDVGTTLRVTDTVTGDIQEYQNPLGTAFDPVLDTDAFATCDEVAARAPR